MPRGAQPLERLTPTRLEEIAKSGVITDIYAQAQKDLNGIIREVEKIGLPKTDAEFKRLQALEGQVNRIQNTVTNAVSRRTEPGAKRLYKGVQGNTAVVINNQLPDDITFKPTFGLVDQNKVTIAAEALFRDLVNGIDAARKPIDNIIRRVQIAGQVDSQITQAIGVEQLAGKDIQQLAESVANIIKSEVSDTGGTVTITGKDGIKRTYNLDYYAEMVVRTRTREIATLAAQQVTLQASAELGIPPLVQVTRHANESPICVDVLNRTTDNIFTLVPDPNNPQYADFNSEGEGGPPWHPNCIHVAVPFIALPEEET